MRIALEDTSTRATAQPAQGWASVAMAKLDNSYRRCSIRVGTIRYDKNPTVSDRAQLQPFGVGN